MATSIHPSIPVLSPSFLYHPYIPSFQSKDFSFTCLLPFFGCTLHNILNNILPQAICCCFFMPCYLMYACQLLLLQLLIWASFNLDRLPGGYLLLFTTYTVIDVLLIMCLLAFFVTSADKSQLFMLFTNILPEAICCLETLNVYVVLLMLFCIIL